MFRRFVLLDHSVLDVLLMALYIHSWWLLVPILFHGSLYSHSWYGTRTVADTSITTLCVLFSMMCLVSRPEEAALVLVHMPR